MTHTGTRLDRVVSCVGRVVDKKRRQIKVVGFNNVKNALQEDIVDET